MIISTRPTVQCNGMEFPSIALALVAFHRKTLSRFRTQRNVYIDEDEVVTLESIGRNRVRVSIRTAPRTSPELWRDVTRNPHSGWWHVEGVAFDSRYTALAAAVGNIYRSLEDSRKGGK